MRVKQGLGTQRKRLCTGERVSCGLGSQQEGKEGEELRTQGRGGQTSEPHVMLPCTQTQERIARGWENAWLRVKVLLRD